MSIQEVKKILTHGYRDFLVESGFEKPSTVSSEMVFRHKKHPDRSLTIGTAPMFRNCVLYEFKTRGLDDKQSLFSFPVSPERYSWPGITLFEYRDFEELVQVFGLAKRIHLSWLNSIFNEDDISSFTEKLNSIRRTWISKASQFNADESSDRNRLRSEEKTSLYKEIRIGLGDKWSEDVVSSLVAEGKLTRRTSSFRIEDDTIRGPRFDGEYRIIDRYVVGPHSNNEFYIVNDEVFGPNGKEPYFIIGGTIWGPNDQMPWFRKQLHLSEK